MNDLIVGDLYKFESPTMEYGSFYLEIDPKLFISKMIKIYNGSILLFLGYVAEDMSIEYNITIKFLYDTKILYTRIARSNEEKYFKSV